MLKSDVLGRKAQILQLAVNHDKTHLCSGLHLASPFYALPRVTTPLIRVMRSKSLKTLWPQETRKCTDWSDVRILSCDYVFHRIVSSSLSLGPCLTLTTGGLNAFARAKTIPATGLKQSATQSPKDLHATPCASPGNKLQQRSLDKQGDWIGLTL